MKKTIIIVAAALILALGAITAVYAMDNNNPNNFLFRGSMMNQSDDSYASMIDIMRSNGFEAAADAMENGDYNAMNDTMKNLTDEQYKQMTEIMNNNGFSSMGSMMSNYSKDEMLNLHNSMMRR